MQQVCDGLWGFWFHPYNIMLDSPAGNDSAMISVFWIVFTCPTFLIEIEKELTIADSWKLKSRRGSRMKQKKNLHPSKSGALGLIIEKLDNYNPAILHFAKFSFYF